MNKHFLKNIRDNIPESLKYLSAPFIRYKLIRNDEYCRYYKLLSEENLEAKKQSKNINSIN